jgi:phosphoribosyl 1,2-cyclic phosphodiesterase
MKRTRQAISYLHEEFPVSAVLLTHLHGDHISYYPLRVLEDCGLPLCLHEDSVAVLKEKHYNDYGFKNLQLHPYKNKPFCIGDFKIKPFEVIHNPLYATFGFEICCQDKKIVIATDFCQWENLLEHFVDADFIFVESNHDLALLKQYYNPNSRYHLPNPQTSRLLAAAIAESKKPPQAVMLGHISSQRNTPRLAVRETTLAFERIGLPMNFDLSAAPLKDIGAVVRI